LTCLKATFPVLRHDRGMKEHSHTPAAIKARLTSKEKFSYLRDIVYGGVDGAVTTFAIVAGVQGAGLSTSVILILGAANIVADGFSMAAGNYSATKADLDDRKRIIEVEERHIRQHRSGEIEELRQILTLRGLSGETLDAATELIIRDKEKWIGFMLTDEYGLSADEPRPIRSALATFVAFLAAGSVPLLPFVFAVPEAFTVSIVATALTFFLIGTGKSKWSLAKWWYSGCETLLIGSTAAAVAYAIGSLFQA
jgi:VIT1/CCC1 family predicted Fe2+/Mn2+ transporter